MTQAWYARGPANELSMGSVGSGPAAATITGSPPAQVLNLVLPKGEKGDPGNDGKDGVDGEDGAPNELSIGTVESGDTASATIDGTPPTQTLNLVLPKGEQGTGIEFKGRKASYAALPSTANPGDAYVVESDPPRVYVWDNGFPPDGAGMVFGSETSWADVRDKPATFPPAPHTHAAADITAGTIAVGRLPVGTTTGTVAAGDDARITAAVLNSRKVNGHALSADVTVTKADVGLGSVDNTADLDKPVSTAVQVALDAVAASGGAVSSVAGRTGDVVVTKTDVGLGNVDDTADVDKPVSAAAVAALAGKVDTSRTVNGHALTGDVTVTKSDVGLGNVDNTTDAAKPISTATQAALDAKVPATRKINGYPLSVDVTIGKTDVGLGNVANVAAVQAISGISGAWMGAETALPGTGATGVLYVVTA